MKFIVHQDFVEDKIFDCPQGVCEYVENFDFYDAYDDILDEVYETAQICGYEYSPAEALKAVDTIAYRCGYNDWLNSKIYDDYDGLSYQLDCMVDGDSIRFFDFVISFEEDEEK